MAAWCCAHSSSSGMSRHARPRRCARRWRRASSGSRYWSNSADQPRVRPGVGVHAVRHVVDRHFGLGKLGPEDAPHLPRHLAVQLADAVGQARGAQRQHGHAELRPPGVVVAAQVEEPLAVESHPAPVVAEEAIHQVEAERVVARGHRRVRGEQRIGADGPQRGVERQPLSSHQLADALELQEGRVPLVHVPDGRLDAQRAQRAHAADAQHELLRDAHLHVAAVQPGRQLPIGRRVLLDIRVHQIDAGCGPPGCATPWRRLVRPGRSTLIATCSPLPLSAGCAGTSAKSSFS